MGLMACTEPQCLYKGALYPFIHSFKKVSKLESSHYADVSTDPLVTGRGSLAIRGAHFFGKECVR